MNPYSLLISLHVISAIFGLGPLLALALVAAAPGPVLPVAWFSRLLRLVGFALAAMFVTGFLVDTTLHGALHGTNWLRLSVGLFVVLCALQGVVRRRLKRAVSDQLPPGLGGLLWTMCGLVAAITWLMEAKPW
ncbi:MAG TPA: hypothetical protein VIM71_02175 [Lacunisphaera sp.]